MKHLEVRQKYSATRRIFNSLLGVSSGDETLRLIFDILLPKSFTGAFFYKSPLDVREVEAKSVRAFSRYFRRKLLLLEIR